MSRDDVEGLADDRVQDLAEAMSHPQRARVLFAVADQTFGVAASETSDVPDGVTVQEIADRLGESYRRVRYHLTALVDLGFVEAVGARQRRGTVEQYYSAKNRPIVTKHQVEGDGIPVRLQQRLSIEILKAIFADTSAALAAGSFNRRPEWIAARLPGQVDERGWKELAAVYEAALAEAQEVVLSSQDRLKRSEERPIPIRGALLLFEVP